MESANQPSPFASREEIVAPDACTAVGHDGPDLGRRFGGVARLYGAAAAARLRDAHVVVAGLGGVGSWSAEALARSGVGRLTLIDLDHVAESNLNRQVHALSETIGMAKAIAMKQRIAAINPDCAVVPVEEFVDADNVASLLGLEAPDYLIDAVDQVRAKVAMILHCRHQGVPLVTVGSAGGQTDPTRVRVDDLARTEHEPLLAKVRKRLRTQYGFARDPRTRFGIDAVYSTEPIRYPSAEEGAPNAGLNCGGFGSSVAVTAVFGMVAAAHVINRIAQGNSGRSSTKSAKD